MGAPVTLKKNREFSLVYSKGKSGSTKYLVLVALPMRYGGVRVGFSVSKKVGKSVARNKLRRRLKECVRELLPDVKGSYWVIFIARAGAAQREYASLKKDMTYLFRKRGLLEGKKH